MTKPFLIRHPETREEYELADVAFFVREYQPRGFVIVDPAPMNYTVPEIPKAEKPKAEPKQDDEPKAEKPKATGGKLD